MANAKELLTHFSVSDDEADIYLALLSLGTAAISEIATKIKKNRTATHFHIKKLVEKGLIHGSQEGRTFTFTATTPSELAERFDRMTTDFKSFVPQLEALKRIDVETPRVQVTESRSGFFQVYDEISSLPENSTFYAIEGVDALKNELTLLSSSDTKNFYTKVIARSIAAKLIITEEAAGMLHELITKDNLALLQQRRLEVRTHAANILPFQGLSLMYGNTVAHLFPETNLVITIKHQGIADSFKATFDALFSFGKHYEYAE